MQRKLMVLIGVSLAVVLLDQWSKYEVVQSLTYRLDRGETLGERLELMFSRDPGPVGPSGVHFRPKRSITVSENFFRLRYAENPGAAWGLMRNVPEHLRGPFFHLVTLLAVGFISYYFLKLGGTRQERWAYWGLPLVLGGAVGNWIDRVSRGFVVDFLEAHWMDRIAWPSFNIADTAICVGVGMLFVDAFVRRDVKSPSAVAP